MQLLPPVDMITLLFCCSFNGFIVWAPSPRKRNQLPPGMLLSVATKQHFITNGTAIRRRGPPRTLWVLTWGGSLHSWRDFHGLRWHLITLSTPEQPLFEAGIASLSDKNMKLSLIECIFVSGQRLMRTHSVFMGINDSSELSHCETNPPSMNNLLHFQNTGLES